YLFAPRSPEHPLTEQALRWLVQFYASSEASSDARRGMDNNGAARASGNDMRKASDATTSDISKGASGPVMQTSATAPLRGETPPAVGLSSQDRLRRAVELGKYLEAARP